MKSIQYLILFLVVGTLVACGGGEETPAATPRSITLMTHEAFDASESVLAEFEATSGVTVTILPAGDTGAALSQAILTREEPLADVFYGVDNTFMGRALAADIFERYESPLLAEIPDDFELDSSYRLLPVDVADVCLNYDRNWFEAAGLAPPGDLADLTDSRYRGLLAVQDPSLSSPGLAFLLATVERFGTEGPYSYLDYWADLRANEVLVTNSWNDTYYGAFTATGDGDRPLVVSYASSPPAEVYFNELEEPPTAAVTAAGTCFRQIEFVGILRGTADRAGAETLVDFMLSKPFQEDMPLRMFVFPVNQTASLPALFSAWTEPVEEPALLDTERIDANRGTWINAWSGVMFP